MTGRPRAGRRICAGASRRDPYCALRWIGPPAMALLMRRVGWEGAGPSLSLVPACRAEGDAPAEITVAKIA
jgi:hypothetical protein